MDKAGEKQPVTLTPNQFIILKADQSNWKTQLGRFDGKKIVPLSFQKKKPYGVSLRNVGQKFLQEALMTSADQAPLVIVKVWPAQQKPFIRWLSAFTP